MKPYEYRQARWRSKDHKRKQRLVTKLQKADALPFLPLVLTLPTWNQRFKTIQSLRNR